MYTFRSMHHDQFLCEVNMIITNSSTYVLDQEGFFKRVVRLRCGRFCRDYEYDESLLGDASLYNHLQAFKKFWEVVFPDKEFPKDTQYSYKSSTCECFYLLRDRSQIQFLQLDMNLADIKHTLKPIPSIF
jgi:hypothetical protein